MPKRKLIQLEDDVLTIVLEGKLNTVLATELIGKLGRYSNEEVKKVVFDATNLEYIASSGIRAVLFANQMFEEEPEVEIIGACDNVYKVFEMTGITQFFKFVR